MKTASFVVALLWNTCSALAQGSLLFANAAPGLNAPITDGFGNRLNGPGFTANLYFAPGVVTDSGSLFALGQPASFWTNGYFVGGERTIPAVAGGGVITAQVRVWNAAFATWSDALNHGGYGTYLGISTMFQVTLAPLPYPPSVMTNMKSFNVGLVSCWPTPLAVVPIRIVANKNSVLLTWPTYECDFWVLQQSPTLDPTNWLTVPMPPVLFGLPTGEIQRQVLLPPPLGTMFYRLVWQ
jgi:hypothetical protein